MTLTNPTTTHQEGTMNDTTPTAVATLSGRKVHTADAAGKPLCGATSIYHIVPTRRPVNCAKCKALETNRYDGELYRNDEGNEVWRILDRTTGQTVQDDIASDHDYQWILDQLNAPTTQD